MKKDIRWTDTLQLALAIWGGFIFANNVSAKDKPPSVCERIVSLSPSITDSLDALDLSQKIVGLTKYCQVPDPQRLIKQPISIGGLLDLNIESVISIEPDIIFNGENGAATNTIRLRQFNFKVVSFPQTNLDDIENSILIIANTCHIPEKGQAVVDEFRTKLKKLQAQIQTATFKHNVKPKVLILYGYDENNGLLSATYAAGSRSFHGDVLQFLGVENAYQGSLAAPLLSQESILAMNPDMIFILRNSLDAAKDPFNLKVNRISPNWHLLNEISAVRHHQVFEIIGHDSLMPSIRIIHLAKIMTGLIYELSQ